MKLLSKKQIDDIEINYVSNKPFINIKHNHSYSKLQNQLIYLLFLDNYIDYITAANDDYFQESILKEMIIYINIESYTNLFKISIRNGFILLTNFIIFKKIASENCIRESFLKINCLFSNKICILQEKTLSKEIYDYYFSFLNKNIIFTYLNIFPISIFAKVIKYPVELINRHFKQFDWNDLSIVKKQIPTLEIFIKHIYEIDDMIISNLSNILDENEIETLILVREMS